MEHFETLEATDIEKLRGLPTYLDGHAYQYWMGAAPEKKATWKAAIKFIDDEYEREKDLGHLQWKFSQKKFPGFSKISINKYASELKTDAKEAWPDAADESDQRRQEVARTRAIKDKLWEAFPLKVRDQINVLTKRNRYKATIEQMVEKAEILMSGCRDEHEEAPYRMGTINELVGEAENQPEEDEEEERAIAEEWLAQPEYEKELIKKQMRLEREQALNNLQTAITQQQLANQAAQVPAAQPQQPQQQPFQHPQYRPQRGGGPRGRGGRGGQRGRGGFGRGRGSRGGAHSAGKPQEDRMQCYECGERGHFARECPSEKAPEKRPARYPSAENTTAHAPIRPSPEAKIQARAYPRDAAAATAARRGTPHAPAGVGKLTRLPISNSIEHVSTSSRVIDMYSSIPISIHSLTTTVASENAIDMQTCKLNSAADTEETPTIGKCNRSAFCQCNNMQVKRRKTKNTIPRPTDAASSDTCR